MIIIYKNLCCLYSLLGIRQLLCFDLYFNTRGKIQFAKSIYSS